jgi:hypothetical protein
MVCGEPQKRPYSAIYLTLYSYFIVMPSESKILSKKQFAKKLVEKHQRLMEANSREFDLLHKFFVLEEKQDLIVHWIRNAEKSDSKAKAKEYVKQKTANEKQMADIKTELAASFPAAENMKMRHEVLKKHVDSHKTAINYWAELAK